MLPLRTRAARLLPKTPGAWTLAALLAIALGLTCVVGSWSRISVTFDEPYHLITGIEWWQHRSYRLWTENPPLARAAAAALPYLSGLRLPADFSFDFGVRPYPSVWRLGRELLYAGPGYESNLRLMRWGALPFYLLSLVTAGLLAGGRRRPRAAFFAVALLASHPTLVGHGAIATTDVPFTACFLLLALALGRWFERPTFGRAAWVGVGFALALLTKLSALAFFPALLVAWVIARKLCGLSARPGPGQTGGTMSPASPTTSAPAGGDEPAVARPRALRLSRLLGQGAGAALLAFVVVWGGYHFSVGRAGDMRPEAVGGAWTLVPPPAARGPLDRLLLESKLPAPELVHGLYFLAAHNRAGHPSYLLGDNSKYGFWYFYPVSLFFKTPLPFLGALVLAAVPLLRRRRRLEDPLGVALVLTALGVLAISMRSNVNLGIRHVMLVYPLVAVAAARTLDAWIEDLREGRRRLVTAAALALVAAQAATTVVERPVHIAFANLLAGPEPARVMLDSDLEWGQSLLLLREESERRGIQELTLGYFGAAKVCLHGLPRIRPLLPDRRPSGWVAISENYYRERSYSGLLRDPCDPVSFLPPAAIQGAPFRWLQGHRPVAIVGNSLRLYHLP
jgi:hypothetical protein